MDKGKRPMTVAQLQAEERTKKSKSYPAHEILQSNSKEQLEDYDPVYQGPISLSSLPPFVAEPENVANIVGDECKDKTISQVRESMVVPERITCRCEAYINRFISVDFWDVCHYCYEKEPSVGECKKCGYLGEHFLMCVVRLQIYDDTGSATVNVFPREVEMLTQMSFQNKMRWTQY